MARQLHKLSAAKVDKATKPGMHSDGGGLNLRISGTGAKSWIYRFMLNGKAREMGLGSITKVPLKKAREKAQACRELVADGIDPIEHGKALKAADRLEQARAITFDQCAEKYIEANKAGWSNAKHAKQWESTLNTYASPVFGNLAVQDVDITLVLLVVEPIWSTKNETANRVRGRIEAVLDWAAVRGYREKDNPARWKGQLDKVLPSPRKVRQVEHLPAMAYAELPQFIKKLRKQEGIAAKALEFTILTGCRTNEVLGATWKEFDAKERVWVIPAERMKGRREHRVPLSKAAYSLLESMKEHRLEDYVFQSTQTGKHLSNMAMTSVLRRMQIDNVTVHGFRSTFRDWMAEQTSTPNHVAEAALAHTIEAKTERAYRRGDLYAKRAKLMEGWARYIDSKQAKIVPIKGAKSASE